VFESRRGYLLSLLRVSELFLSLDNNSKKWIFPWSKLIKHYAIKTYGGIGYIDPHS
jgi:hypothetical protein